MFQVIVGNVGTVLETEDREEASACFEEERARSRFEESSRAFLEPVSMLEDGEPVRSWDPPTDENGKLQGRDENGGTVPSVADFLESPHPSGEVYELRAGWDAEDDSDEDGGSVSYGNLEPVRGEMRDELRDGALLVYVPHLCSGSDYSGGTLARSNVRALVELAESEGIVHFELHGGHGTHGVAFPLWVRSAELLRVLEGLDGYPVVDESLMSEMECEDESEAWDAWVRYDFVRALEEETGTDVDGRIGNGVSDEELQRFFWETMESAGTYFEHTEEGPRVDLDELVRGMERADVLALEGAVSATADEEERACSIFRTVREQADALEDPARDLLSSDYDTDKRTDSRPVLEAWERAALELRELRVLDLETDPGASLVAVLRDIGDAPVGEWSAERVRDAARRAVLPVLPDRIRGELAEAWERDPGSGLPVLEHLRTETLARWTDYVRSRNTARARRRTILLPQALEDAVPQALEDGTSADELVRSYVLDRIAEELRRRMGEGSGTGTLWSSAGGWADVLEVDRDAERVRVRQRVGEDDSPGEEEVRELSSFSYVFQPY